MIRKNIKNRFIYWFTIVCIGILFIKTPLGIAIDTTPKTINYQGRLLDKDRKPITTPQKIRFSIWKNADFLNSDRDGAGNIVITAINYANWQEEQTFTPDQWGIFSVQIWASNPLPDVNFNLHKFLQIEVKPATSANTAYEILDPTGNLNDTNDRKPINSAFYALNADKIDNTEIGTTSGSLVKLGSNNQWGINFIPAGTNENKFVLDNDNNAWNEIILQFGQTLNKVLKFDILRNHFVFNANLLIEGLLKLTGNQIILNNEATSDTDVFIVANQQTSSGGTIKYNSTTKTWQIENNGNWFSNIATTNSNQVLTNKTIDASQNNITNLNVNTLQPVSQTIQFIPEYPGVTLFADGTNNSGTMFADFEDNGWTNKHNFYVWTSRQNTLQDYDLVLRFQLPKTFKNFEANPISLNLKTQNTNSLNNKIDVSIENGSGAIIPLNNNLNLRSNLADQWETKNITFSGVPVFYPGEWITCRIKLSSDKTGKAYAGELLMYYLGN